MKKKNTLVWILSVFLILSAFVYFPSFSSIFLLFAGVLLLPVNLIQSKIAFYLKKPVKTIVIIVLMILAFAFLPKSESTEDNNHIPPVTTEQTEATEKKQEETTGQTETTEPVVEYHEDEHINRLLTAYNELAEYPITPEMVEDGAYDYQAHASCNGVWVTIYATSNNGLFVDYDDEATNDEAIKVLFRDFNKAINPELTDDDIEVAWAELQTEEYDNPTLNFLDVQGIECTYVTSALNNGETRYIVKTNCKTYY